MIHSFLVETPVFANKVVLAIAFTAFTGLLLRYAIKLIEMGYVLKYKKPLYIHFYLRLRKLTNQQKSILQNQFTFYKKLSDKEKKYFEHRVASFIKDKDFIPREGMRITEEMKVLISATAIMLTFGFRDFYIGLISKIVVYPEAFYSTIKQEYHKGEFNPKLKALVLSWKDFVEGYNKDNDNLNLGIHEFAHAIHLNSIKERDVSSTIFIDSFNELSRILKSNDALKDNIASSSYFRNYAYTNQFEFLAVAIENFFETPTEFKTQFPQVYRQLKQMLNFNVVGY